MTTRISLAIDRYDRHFPFFDGTLELPAGLELDVRQVGQSNPERDGEQRHQRMLKHGEFDAAEVSFSSYVMARARGLPFTAIPAFPRRLFSQTQMFVRADSAVVEPAQLAGKRVGLRSFQNTLAVVAKGDLGSEYDVHPRSVTWVVRSRETIPFEAPRGWRIERVAKDADLDAMLVDGAIDALFISRVPESFASGKVRRLFPEPRRACTQFFARNAFMPIMHVIAMRDEAIAAEPAAPELLLEAYRRSMVIAAGYPDDPGWSQLPFASMERERQQADLPGDIWPVGFAANHAAIARFLRYSNEQGLIDEKLAPEALFDSSTLLS